MRREKLYHLTTSSFALVHHVDARHRPHPLPAADVPTLTWPDGRWCVPANKFMIELCRNARSRRNRGGTLHTYATQISHLIRFCYDNQTDLIDLTDNQFTLFVRGLAAQRQDAPHGPSVRDSNTVRAIAHRCLEFLDCVGRFYGEQSFVGEAGCIRAEKVEVTSGFRQNGRQASPVVTWHHHSLPTPEPQRKRLPVSEAAISELRMAVVKIPCSSFVRKRRFTLLRLLEITGGRRSEIRELTVASVLQAAAMACPMLRLITVKGRGRNKDRTREIPISRHDAMLLKEFAEKNRRPVIRKTCGLERDDGFLLVNEKTGKQLEANTVTQEIWLLRRGAGISYELCAHMFRHRYCTKLMIALIQQHEARNQDEFRRLLLSSEELKQKVCQWTGHSDTASLERYLHLAFEELTGASEIVDAAQLRSKVESLRATLQQVRLEGADATIDAVLAEFLSDLEQHSAPREARPNLE